MTLRLRLVLGLVGLLTVGLAVFGVATYSAYSRSQYDSVDDQLTSATATLAGRLVFEAREGGSGPSEPYEPRDERGGPAPTGSLPSVWATLVDGSGTAYATVDPYDGSPAPQLDQRAVRSVAGRQGAVVFVDVPSVDDDGPRWRMRLEGGPSAGGQGLAFATALPLDDVQGSLDRLLLIELAAGAVLLALMAGGSWVILRSGLRPLENMATSARSITAGDLSQRVAPADERTEVGQLGLAINTMLGEIEDAFAEREATEAKLRQFLADASHELRTPLTSIRGFAELFRVAGEDPDVDLAVVMGRIESEAERMGVLVEDLLALARLDQTRPVVRAPVDLAVLAADACSDAKATAPDRPVSLDAPAPAVVQGDEGLLRQAIGNLVANAVKHTPDGTPVEVSVRQVGPSVEVVVRDHGEGLSAQALEKAFDRFWQADAARVGHGAGLGLPIVAAVAEQHGGSVTGANAPGGGATFTLVIPTSTPPT